eukprot:gene12697-15929_t
MERVKSSSEGGAQGLMKEFNLSPATINVKRAHSPQMRSSFKEVTPGSSPPGSSPKSGLRQRASHFACNSPAFRQNRHPFFIGVAGGTASGKTTVCSSILSSLHDQCVVLLTQDSFYRSLTEAEMADISNYNFDHPDALDVKARM